MAVESQSFLSYPPSPQRGAVSQLMSVIRENQSPQGQPLELLLPTPGPLAGRSRESRKGLVFHFLPKSETSWA